MSNDEGTPRPKRWDVIAHGIPQSEAQAKLAGIPWDVCKRANERQQAVADCRRRAATNPDLLNMRLD